MEANGAEIIIVNLCILFKYSNSFGHGTVVYIIDEESDKDVALVTQ